MSGYGISGREYDRHSMANADQSTIYKMKETYWTAKQAVMTKLGKKQDEHIVASDAELDSKLEVFGSIQKSSVQLLHVIERYQDQLCALSREENLMGRMLKTDSVHDKTRAGKMMAAVGKAQCYSSQQVMAVRAPLVRLYQEVETFQRRAIADTMVTVHNMEAARTEYRGALMWMKDVSEVLDPDTSRQLQKFRAVQQQVKKTKVRFDKLKLDTMQKVDLLAASRCNMYSQVLARYQGALLLYWSKTSTRMSAVSESFKGYQYYEFSTLKQLGEPSRKLADETGATNDDQMLEENEENLESGSTSKSVKSKTAGLNTESESNREHGEAFGNLLDELDREFPPQKTRSGEEVDTARSTSHSPPLLEFEDDEEDVDLEEIRRLQDEEFGLSGGLGGKKGTAAVGKKKQLTDVDLLSDELEGMLIENKDDRTLLNEILSTASSSGAGGLGGGGGFDQEWTAVFGEGRPVEDQLGTPSSPEHSSATFMPSCLLDMAPDLSNQNEPPPAYTAAVKGLMGLGISGRPAAPTCATQDIQGGTNPGNKDNIPSGPKPKKKDQRLEMSAWFNLFAELDPLANPDAIGRSKDDLTDA